MYGEELFYEGITGYMHPHAAPEDPYEKDRRDAMEDLYSETLSE